MNTGRHSSERRGHLVPARAVTLLLALTIVLAGCTGSPSSPGTAATPETPTSQGTAPAQGGPPTPGSPSTGVGQATPASPQIPEVVRKLDVGLQLPWSVVFLPDGTAVVSERDSAQVKSIRDGQTATVGEVPGVDPGGEGGLLGLALSPGFATDRWLYAYFTAPDDNRIARIKITGRSGWLVGLGRG